MAEVEGKKEKDKDFLVQCSQRLPSESEAAKVEGKKEKDKDFLVQCSQRLSSESEAAEVPTHDAILALEEEEEEAERISTWS